MSAVEGLLHISETELQNSQLLETSYPVGKQLNAKAGIGITLDKANSLDQVKLISDSGNIVLLNSNGKFTRIGDAIRIRKWMESHAESKPTTSSETDAMMSGTVS